jgi:outer membrane receptor protein involved in Fe transport
VNTSSGSFVWGGGQFAFTRDFTTQFPGIQQNNSGSSIASLLLGNPSSGIIQYTPRLAYRWGYYGWFIQDDFRVNSRLTLNLGLRWDVEGSATERYNRMNRGWNYGAADPRLTAAARTADPAICPACANLTGGLLFAGENGEPREAFNTRYNQWQPRIGAAFQLTDRTVLRGGFGIYYLPQAFFGGVQGFAIDTPYVATVGGRRECLHPCEFS